MGFITDSLQLFYKRLGPTGSSGTDLSGSLVETWWSSGSSGTYDVSSSFLNYPKDITLSDLTYVTTRNSSSNATYQALPWGSQACDFLWNTLVPSLSYNDQTNVTDTLPPTTYVVRRWAATFTSKSFHRENGNWGVTLPGVSVYPITSSWFIYDPKLDYMATYATSQLSYLHSISGNTKYPTFVGSDSYAYNFIDSGATPAPNLGDEDYVSYDISYPAVNAKSSSSISGQYFDVGQGAAITRASVSRSLVTQSVYYSQTSGTAIQNVTKALKARRLFFPTYVSASGTGGSQDYYFYTFTGYKRSDLFIENGGIYNVKFKLKRKVSKDCYPDTGTFMSVFIHDVQSTAPSPSARVAGASGWYPPDNNIVKIGNGWNGTSTFQFYDISTGYQVEEFNFNVIQYGYPAQLCFEVSGSLANDDYFGCIISDVQMCKIGVTTDPNFIKPTSIGNTYVAETITPGQEPPAEA